MDIVGVIAPPLLSALPHLNAAPDRAAEPPAAPAASERGDADGGGKKQKGEKKIDRYRWEDHPSIHFGKGTHIDFRARFQGDVRSSEAAAGDAEEEAGLDIARRRVGVEGEIRNVLNYQVDAELGSDEFWRD